MLTYYFFLQTALYHTYITPAAILAQVISSTCSCIAVISRILANSMDTRALLCLFFLFFCHAPVVRASSYHCVGGRGKQGTGLVEYKFWRRMPKCCSPPRRFDQPSPIDKTRQETMKMCAFIFSSPLLTCIFFCLICYALSASARGAVREARARH